MQRKFEKMGKILFLIPLLFFSCKDNPVRTQDDSKIILGESIEGVIIGDDSATVIKKLGVPTYIQEGDFNGIIFRYMNGPLSNTFITISYDSLFGFGTISVSLEGPYKGTTRDGIGMNSDRELVVKTIGASDTTEGEQPYITDIYFYPRSTFVFGYDNMHVQRIFMGKPRRK